MVNGNDLLEFEENNYGTLTEKFMELEDIKDRWNAFVMDAFNDR